MPLSPDPPGPADLGALLSPRSIAIVGASNDPPRLSGRPLQILLQHRYPGRIYPVNPHHQAIGGLPAYPSIAAVPEPVDLAAIIVQAALVPGVVEECAAAGVRAVAVFSSGFAEEGHAGRQAEAGMAALARSSGMRMLGPNAEGFFNVTSGIPVTFSPTADYRTRADEVGGRQRGHRVAKRRARLRPVQLGPGGRARGQPRGEYRQRSGPGHARGRRVPGRGCGHARPGAAGGGLSRRGGDGTGGPPGRGVG